MIRRLFYSEIVAALACCAPDNVADDPNCAACPLERECGPGGQVWCSVELDKQAREALSSLMRDNARMRSRLEKLQGREWVQVGQMDPPDDVLVYIRREPSAGHDEVTTGYMEDGRWFVNDCVNKGGRVTHWMDYTMPVPPEGKA